MSFQARGATSPMNSPPNAVASVFADSMSSQCKNPDRVPTEVHRRNASTECHPWRVSKAAHSSKSWRRGFTTSTWPCSGRTSRSRSTQPLGRGWPKPSAIPMATRSTSNTAGSQSGLRGSSDCAKSRSTLASSRDYQPRSR